MQKKEFRRSLPQLLLVSRRICTVLAVASTELILLRLQVHATHDGEHKKREADGVAGGDRLGVPVPKQYTHTL